MTALIHGAALVVVTGGLFTAVLALAVTRKVPLALALLARLPDGGRAAPPGRNTQLVAAGGRGPDHPYPPAGELGAPSGVTLVPSDRDYARTSPPLAPRTQMMARPALGLDRHRHAPRLAFPSRDRPSPAGGLTRADETSIRRASGAVRPTGGKPFGSSGRGSWMAVRAEQDAGPRGQDGVGERADVVGARIAGSACPQYG